MLVPYSIYTIRTEDSVPILKISGSIREAWNKESGLRSAWRMGKPRLSIDKAMEASQARLPSSAGALNTKRAAERESRPWVELLVIIVMQRSEYGMEFLKKAKEKRRKKEKEEIILQIELELAQKYEGCVYRDKIKDKSYMLLRTAQTAYAIRSLEQEIEQEPSELTSPAVKRSPDFLGKNLTHKDRLYDILFLTKADLLNNLYSIGEEVATLVPLLEELIKLSCDCWDGANIGVMDWLVPASVLFGVNQSSFGILYEEWYCEKPKIYPTSKGDFVLEFFFQAYTNYDSLDYQARPVLLSRQRNRLADLIKAGQDAGEAAVKTYLERHWCKVNKEYTLDTYRNLSVHDNLLYNGFWAYEVGAIVKIQGISDVGLRDTVFYPYDAVHFQSM